MLRAFEDPCAMGADVRIAPTSTTRPNGAVPVGRHDGDVGGVWWKKRESWRAAVGGFLNVGLFVGTLGLIDKGGETLGPCWAIWGYY
jgi:hypothetical protein